MQPRTEELAFWRGLVVATVLCLLIYGAAFSSPGAFAAAIAVTYIALAIWGLSKRRRRKTF